MDIIRVASIEEGIAKASQFLYKNVDRQTALFLSGGSSPKPLYEYLAHDARVQAATVALIDERYGAVMHESSNERMIKETNFFSYCNKTAIPVKTVLHNDISLEETADRYDLVVREILFHLPKSVAILGLGEDGHIAGLAPSRKDFENPLFEKNAESLLVGSFDDHGKFGQRITMTFTALSMVDHFLVWVMGENKRQALEEIYNHKKESDIPGRFFMRDDITSKVTLITDISL